MRHDPDPPDAHDDQASIVAHLTAVLSELDAAEAQRVLRNLLAPGSISPDLFEETTPPSRRRPRRPDVVTYQVRVDLAETKPPLWRRLELASDLFLDDLHDVLQVAFGWTDSHLHRFGSGPQYFSPETEYYLGPYDVAEGEDGVAEDEVRLDEVLVDVGDRVFYAYDYGDDWQHVVKLEAILPREDHAPRAVCTAGRRDGPPEDCSGVYGYELIAGATDPTHPRHAELAAEFDRFYGDSVDPEAFGTTRFDLDEINSALEMLGLDATRTDVCVPEPLADLVNAVEVTSVRRRLRRLIADAGLGAPVRFDADTAARMVHPYTWLLNHVGTEGIGLTAAGYLPPVHVEAAVDALGLDEVWIGKANREHHTAPVLHLRLSAQKMGLLRKHRGRLVLTARGRALRTDPSALWWHLAERMPPDSRDDCEGQAGLMLLIAMAAQTSDDLDATVADVLDAIGWMSKDGTPLTRLMAAHAASETKAVLRRIGALTSERSLQANEQPTAEGVAFARAALRTYRN